MESNPPLPIEPEQRLLAVIVFTDIAGFTARVQREESPTLKLMERDFAAMREFSRNYAGTVIKTTGDGLLLYFTSAVHAVEWALKTQRHFARQAKEVPATEVLRHRVGIHLGDVFLRDNDVMGDGVNIAARVQTESPPGGICISHVVYDVVKSKMKLDVIRLEPRKLKNIVENVQMYHVLLEPPQRISRGAAPVRSAAMAPVRDAAARPRRMAVLVALLVAMGLGGGLLFKAHLDQEVELAASQTAHDALQAALLTKQKESPDPDASGPPAAEGLDFAKMTLDRPAGAAGAAPDEAVLRQANAAIRILSAWIVTALPRYNRDRPLLVQPLHDASIQNLTLFTDAQRQLYFVDGGATQKMDWEALRPELQGAVVLSAFRDAAVPPSRDVVRGAEAFAFVHRLPEMASVLLRDRATDRDR